MVLLVLMLPLRLHLMLLTLIKPIMLQVGPMLQIGLFSLLGLPAEQLGVRFLIWHRLWQIAREMQRQLRTTIGAKVTNAC